MQGELKNQILKALYVYTFFSFFFQIVVNNASRSFEGLQQFTDSKVHIFSMSFYPFVLIILFILLKKVADKIKTASQKFFITFFSIVIALLFSTSEFQPLLSGFASMPSHFADWIYLQDYLLCPEGVEHSECDSFSRPWVWGIGWKIFYPFSQLPWIFFGLTITTILICLVSIRVFEAYSLSIMGIVLFFTPTYLFQFERLNTDLLIYAVALLLVISENDKKSSQNFSAIFISLLNLLKPLFILSSIRNHQTTTRRLTLVLFSLCCAIASYKFSFADFQSARLATLYDFHSQIGSQALGIIFLNNHKSETQVFFGIIVLVLVIVSLLFFSSYLKNEIGMLLSESTVLEKNLTLFSAGTYFFIYITGSSVFYKSIFLTPIVLLVIKKISINNRISLIQFILIIAATSLGTVANRLIASFFAAVFCGGIIIFSILNKYRNKELGGFSAPKI
jgi:hypothetical protein